MKQKSNYSRTVFISAAALFLLAIGMVPLGTEAEAQDTIKPKPTTIVAHESVLTVDERQSIETFLIDEFRAKRISRDLVAIVMRRVDAFATGSRDSDSERDHPKTTSYPSIALQIAWQAYLQDIAVKFRSKFKVKRPPPSHMDLIIEDAPYRPPLLNSVLWYTAEFIEQAQGGVSAQLMQYSISRDFLLDERRSAPRKRLGKYESPIRISSSKIVLVDAAIPQILDSLKAKYPRIALDKMSFPSAPEVTNLTISADHLNARTMDHVFACVRWYVCRSFTDFSQPSTPDHVGSSFAFLDSIYLANPYGERSAANAVVQLDNEGTIVASLCDGNDTGYQPSLMGRPPLDRERLRACLEAVMGY